MGRKRHGGAGEGRTEVASEERKSSEVPGFTLHKPDILILRRQAAWRR
jgi:hypothetical protein